MRGFELTESQGATPRQNSEPKRGWGLNCRGGRAKVRRRGRDSGGPSPLGLALAAWPHITIADRRGASACCNVLASAAEVPKTLHAAERRGDRRNPIDREPLGPSRSRGLAGAAMTDALRRVFADRIGGRAAARDGGHGGPPDGVPARWRGTRRVSDSITGEALVVGPRGEILARCPQHAALGANARATEPNEPERAAAVARRAGCDGRRVKTGLVLGRSARQDRGAASSS
jgi:hypothetical protein